MKNRIIEKLKDMNPEERRKKMAILVGFVFVLVLVLNLILK